MTRKKASAVWELIKTPTIVVSIITVLSGGVAGLFALIKDSEGAKAEIRVKEKYDEKYSDLLTECAILRATCKQSEH